MGARVQAIFILSSILLLCLPAAVLATLLLLPVWSWLAASFGVAALGPSGPAVWCYAMVYALLAASALLILHRALRRRGSGSA